MLTLKLITEETERVIAGLEKKHFADARKAIEEVIAVDKSRRQAQTELDQNLSAAKKLAAEIGMLMKQGKREEAEEVKTKVAALKETSKELENKKETAEQELTRLLCQIPNIPYDEVPEGTCAEDNWVVKSNLKECVLGKDTVGNWDANPVVETAKLPHWELAKKYNLIDFDLGVKISGAGFPVYRGKGARLQRALIDFFLDEAQKSGYEEIMPPTVVNAASGYGTGQLPDKEGQMYHCEVDDLYLIPTAEVPVTNIYRDVILDEKDLPIKNCAYTQCFRREAGSYGKDVRGLNRLHERLYELTHLSTVRRVTKRCSHTWKACCRNSSSPIASFVYAVATRALQVQSVTTLRFIAKLKSVGSRLAPCRTSTPIRPTD